MDVARGVRDVLERAAGALGLTARAIGAWAAAAAGRLAYRRRELIVIGLLAAGLLGGFAVERGRARAPDLAARLEAEPKSPLTSTPHATPLPIPTRRAARTSRLDPCVETRARLARAPRPPAPAPNAPLDLNRATAAELMRLPGIGPRLAARLVARRENLGGRFRSPAELANVPGLGRSRAEALGRLIPLAAESVDAAGEVLTPPPASSEVSRTLEPEPPGEPSREPIGLDPP